LNVEVMGRNPATSTIALVLPRRIRAPWKTNCSLAYGFQYDLGAHVKCERRNGWLVETELSSFRHAVAA
jgi:hypothetical protein